VINTATTLDQARMQLSRMLNVFDKRSLEVPPYPDSG
jgi:hypothetical protein